VLVALDVAVVVRDEVALLVAVEVPEDVTVDVCVLEGDVTSHSTNSAAECASIRALATSANTSHSLRVPATAMRSRGDPDGLIHARLWFRPVRAARVSLNSATAVCRADVLAAQAPALALISGPGDTDGGTASHSMAPGALLPPPPHSVTRAVRLVATGAHAAATVAVAVPRK
jgi:hypothetical protein